MEERRTSVITYPEESRASILGKTYLLLTVGFITMALGTGVGFQFLPMFAHLGKWGYLILSLVATIGTMFLALIFQRNILGYLFFTLFTFTVGFFDAPAVAVILQSPFLLEIFKETALITGVVTGALSLFVLITKKDFGFLGGFLFTGLVLVVIMAVVGLFWHNSLMNVVMSGMGALVFSGYILYDTSRLVNEKGTPVEIAIALFLDIINLFWSLFNLLVALKEER